MHREQRLTILIVDDDPIARRILDATLSSGGHRVVSACNGVEALQRFQQTHPDMVFLDVNMPKMGGYEIARAIRGRMGDVFIPILFLTAETSDEALSRCIEVGGDGFLTKPIRPALVEAELRALSRIRQLHHDLTRQRDELDSLHARLQAEFLDAKQVYDKMLAGRTEDVPEVRWRLSSMNTFNGDLVLSVRSPGSRIHTLLGDFTGHGLPAAIGAPQACSIFFEMTRNGYSIGEILPEMNRTLQELLPTGHFLAAALIGLDLTDGTASIWNGGIPDVLVRRARGGVRHRVASSHLPLGVVGGRRFDPEPERFPLEPGERIYACSDGVRETRDPSGAEFGTERIEKCLEAQEDDIEMLDLIERELACFRAHSAQADDVTLAEVRFDGPIVPRTGEEHLRRETTPATTWKSEMLLHADSLKRVDPVPLVLQTLSGIDGLHAHRGPIYTVLTELFTNALDHGVLGLDSNLKQGANGFDTYVDLRRERLAALQEGWVRLVMENAPEGTGGRLTLTVEDSGAGFELQENRPGSTVLRSGRGLHLVQSICHAVTFPTNGSRIQAVYRWGSAA